MPTCPSPLAPLTAVNQTWTTDFKGHFRTGDRVYCYPLDAARRLQSLRVALRRAGGARPTRPPGRCLNARLPSMACPSASAAITGARLRVPASRRLSRLSVWWLRLGSSPNASPSAIPSKMGRTSNFIRCSKPTPRDRRPRTRGPNNVALLASAPNTTTSARTRRSQRRACRPAAISPSPRSLPHSCPPLEYPGHLGVRRVSTIGQVAWAAPCCFSPVRSPANDVAFEEVDDGLWTIRFATLALGSLRRASPPHSTDRPATAGRSPAAPARA